MVKVLRELDFPIILKVGSKNISLKRCIGPNWLGLHRIVLQPLLNSILFTTNGTSYKTCAGLAFKTILLIKHHFQFLNISKLLLNYLQPEEAFGQITKAPRCYVAPLHRDKVQRNILHRRTFDHRSLTAQCSPPTPPLPHLSHDSHRIYVEPPFYHQEINLPVQSSCLFILDSLFNSFILSQARRKWGYWGLLPPIIC